MRIIVTGGNGFIGSHFIDHCLSFGTVTPRYDVINIDKGTSISSTFIDEKFGGCEWGYDKIEEDIININSIEFPHDLKNVEACIHFAAESHVDNSMGDMNPFISTNIHGTMKVAEFCAKNDIFMVHVSTDEVYGDAEGGRVFQSGDELDPQNFYSASKAAGDMMVKTMRNKYPNFKYCIVRPSNNYGPRQDNTKFLPKAIEFIRDGKAFPMYGDGAFTREWTHVRDTAEVIERILRCPGKLEKAGDVVTISSGDAKTNMEVFLALTEFFKYIDEDYKPLVEFIPDPRGNCHDREYRMHSNCGRDNWRDFDKSIKEMVKDAINGQG
jgi:dTDP-glucose 4,6-dehydratase